MEQQENTLTVKVQPVALNHDELNDINYPEIFESKAYKLTKCELVIHGVIKAEAAAEIALMTKEIMQKHYDPKAKDYGTQEG